MAAINRVPIFPCSIVLEIPFPAYRLASSALRALEVDAELSQLVSRSLSLITPASCPNDAANEDEVDRKTILRTEYKATTDRMLRVAVNGFMESLGVVISVMEELDVDIIEQTYAAGPS
ncbi:MAG: hypothetical protein M1834_002190 [Cirrosporium novae-zelandiae]|nr:MAG: hypothetical protein M1834_002190 [Cirrosporium novae-zelandiae]